MYLFDDDDYDCDYLYDDNCVGEESWYPQLESCENCGTGFKEELNEEGLCNKCSRHSKDSKFDRKYVNLKK